MKEALLILILSQQGYWFGGRTAELTLQWAAPPPSAAVLTWELRYGEIALASGSLPLPHDADAEATLRFELPEVRVRTPLQLHWRVMAPSRDAGQANQPDPVEIDRGAAQVDLFPDDVLAPLASLLRDQNLFVLDGPEGLPVLLKAHDLRFNHLDSLDQIGLKRSGILLVGAGQAAGTWGVLARPPLLNAARRGMQVMVFRQGLLHKRPQRGRQKPSGLLGGLKVVPRLAPKALCWRQRHALFRGLSQRDLQSWVRQWGRQPQPAIRVPADVPALELAWWPPDGPPETPSAAALDVAVLTRTVGHGRIVLWQIPLGDWQTDPRSQILLVNAIDYLLTAPSPTPAHSDRRMHKPNSPPLATGDQR